MEGERLEVYLSVPEPMPFKEAANLAWQALTAVIRLLLREAAGKESRESDRILKSPCWRPNSLLLETEMQNKQNQTDPNSLPNQANASELGTGVFAIPDVTQAVPRAVKRELVSGITYQDCVQRGGLTIAFKWVPYTVASYIDIQNTTCGEPCIDTCPRPGCICVDGVCVGK
jgi:hypothetical protein